MLAIQKPYMYIQKLNTQKCLKTKCDKSAVQKRCQYGSEYVYCIYTYSYSYVHLHQMKNIRVQGKYKINVLEKKRQILDVYKCKK